MKATKKDSPKGHRSNIKLLSGQIAILVVAVGFIVYGIWRDEVSVVLVKAIRLCMQCMGLE